MRPTAELSAAKFDVFTDVKLPAQIIEGAKIFHEAINYWCPLATIHRTCTQIDLRIPCGIGSFLLANVSRARQRVASRGPITQAGPRAQVIAPSFFSCAIASQSRPSSRRSSSVCCPASGARVGSLGASPN